MTNLNKKFASAIAAAALLVNTTLPAFAGTTIVLSGNGVDTDNDAVVELNHATVVQQTNEADISNNVDVSANTGDNAASRNTGGDVEISTGNSSANVAVSNAANSNVADVDGCCDYGADVLIEGNGDNSDNTADLKVSNTTVLTQWNEAKVKNDVDVDANTGFNRANRNTGGDVSITTGNAKVGDGLSNPGVYVSNVLNSNSARIGGGGNGHLSLRILENGVDSDNDIVLDLDHSIVLIQGNEADVENDVDVDANTGLNKADRNTGGEVSIDTGDAKANVLVDTMANFNFADVDCGCLFDVLAKIAGNGDNSDNDIYANLNDALVATQYNDYSCGGRHHRGGGSDWLFGDLGSRKRGGSDCNDVDVHVDTGSNRAKSNTGDSEGGDPSIETGNAYADVEVINTANSNILGDGSGLELPDLPEVDLGFDLGSSWALFLAFFWSHMGA
jgi:hypothetical protein